MSDTSAFTMGVEEEYQIVGAQSRELRPRSKAILHEAEQDIGEHVSNELFLSQIEIGTSICQTLADVREQIIKSRRAVIEAARHAGSEIAAAGTHPFSHWEDQAITPKTRYFGLRDDFQQLAREHLICGCHVHVGIPDREAGIQILNRARNWLHCLIALTGNSPFWVGEDTGYSSYRTEIWRRWPMAGSPSPFQSRTEYDGLVRALVESGAISDETKIYWDIRPADRFNTVEFRCTDVCLSVDEAVMIAGLCRALAVSSLDAMQRDALSFVPARPELLRAAEWRAARYGLDGELVDVHQGRAMPARELIEHFLDELRPALEASGDWDEVSALVQQTLGQGNGASKQRARYEKSGSFEDVVDFVVEETARGVI